MQTIIRTQQHCSMTTCTDRSTAKRMRPPVRFSDVEAEAIESHDESASPIPTSQLWWSQNEVSTLQRRAREFSCELREGKIDEDGDHALLMAHQKTTLMLKNDLPRLVKLPKTTPVHDLAVGWCGKDDGRRGLERYASKKFATSRRWDLINYKMAVLLEQHRQRKIGKREIDEKLIASIARKSSRRSRTFALFTGEADALAVRAQLLTENPSSHAARHQSYRPWRVPRSKGLERRHSSQRLSISLSTSTNLKPQLKRDV